MSFAKYNVKVDQDILSKQHLNIESGVSSLHDYTYWFVDFLSLGNVERRLSKRSWKANNNLPSVTGVGFILRLSHVHRYSGHDILFHLRRLFIKAHLLIMRFQGGTICHFGAFIRDGMWEIKRNWHLVYEDISSFSILFLTSQIDSKVAIGNLSGLCFRLYKSWIIPDKKRITRILKYVRNKSKVWIRMYPISKLICHSSNVRNYKPPYVC